MRRMTMAAMAMLLVGAAQPAQERVIAADGLIEGRIAGQPARTRIDPAAPAMPLIDLALAERAKLKLTGGWGVGIGYRVGTTDVMTRTQVVEVDLGRGTDKRRVGWAKRPFAPGVDVSVGPAALPEPIVRFQLRAPRPGETTTIFPALHESGPFGLFGNFTATFARIDVGGAPMRLRFDPFHARTLATAGAAVRLAQANDGALSGESVPTEIFFGVERPVRDLTLKRPFRLGALAIARLGVRTGDFGSTGAIREGEAAETAPDPDEIVVVAKGKKRDTRRDTLSLGADQLRNCSSIVFDKKADVIRLTCA